LSQANKIICFAVYRKEPALLLNNTFKRRDIKTIIKKSSYRTPISIIRKFLMMIFLFSALF